ncbi:MAG: AtpZ/AtpI family protein [Candidatus Rokubacteria bacterium]|nr:AtpZ/AtpI family protein [Candidatus Rokubacteria bacterium]
MTDEGSPGSRRWIRQVGVLSGVGLTLVICTVLGLGGGYYLDRWLGTSPWLTLVGLLLGIAAGFVNLFRAVGAFDGEQDRQE